MQTVHSNIPYELVHGHEMEIRIHRGENAGDGHQYIQQAKGQMINLVQECEFNSIPYLERWRELEDGTIIHTRLVHGSQVVSIYPVGGGDVYGQGFSITPFSFPSGDRVSPHTKLAVIGSTASIDDSFDSPAGGQGKSPDAVVKEWHSTDWTKQTILRAISKDSVNTGQLYVLTGKEQYELVDLSELIEKGKVFFAWYKGNRLRVAVRETWLAPLGPPLEPLVERYAIAVYGQSGSQWSQEAIYYSEFPLSGTHWDSRILCAASSSGNLFVVIDLEVVEQPSGGSKTHQKEVYFRDSSVSEKLREDTRLTNAKDVDGYVQNGASWWAPIYDFAPETEYPQVEEYDYLVWPPGTSRIWPPPLYSSALWVCDLQPAIELINLAPPGEDPIYDDEYYYTFHEEERTKEEAIWMLENPGYYTGRVYKEVEYDEDYPPAYYHCINGINPIPARSEWSWPNWEGEESTGVSWLWGSGYIWVPGGTGEPGWSWYQATVGYGGIYGIKAGEEYLKGFRAGCNGTTGGTFTMVANEIMDIAFKPGLENLTYYYFTQTGSYHTSTKYQGLVGDADWETIDQYSIDSLVEKHIISGAGLETTIEYGPFRWWVNDILITRVLRFSQILTDADFFVTINFSTGTFLRLTFTPSGDNDDSGHGPYYSHLYDDYETVYRYTLYHFWKEIDILHDARGGDDWDFDESETTYPPYEDFQGAVDHKGNLLLAYQGIAHLYKKDGTKILDPAGAYELSPTGYFQIHAIAGYEQ